MVTGAILLSTLVNLGTLLSVSACGAAATASFAGAGFDEVDERIDTGLANVGIAGEIPGSVEQRVGVTAAADA